MQDIQSHIAKSWVAKIDWTAARKWGWEELLRQRDQLFLWSPVFLAFGIGLYFSLPAEPPFIIGAFALMILVSITALLYPARHHCYALWLPIAAIGLIATGFFASQLRTAIVMTPMLEKKLGPVDVIGTIKRIEYLDAGEGARLVLSSLEIEDLQAEQTPRIVRLKVRDPEGFQVGQRIQALAQLHPPSGPAVPGGFDFQRHSFFQSIGAVGFIYSKPEILEEAHRLWAFEAIEHLRQSITQHVLLTDFEQSKAVIAALMVGSRKAISEEDNEAMRDSGLAHMLAISGLHVGLVAGLLFFFMRAGMALFERFALHHPIKKYAAFIALIGAVFYMLLAGATVPTQRAVLMTGVVLIAVLIGRTAISMRLVAFAAMVVLLLSPEALLSVSFQLSFAAVIALVFAYDCVRDRWSRWVSHAGISRKIALYFLGVCMTSIVAEIAVSPFTLFHFQQMTIYGLLANMVAMPLLAFVIMPAAVGALLLMPLGLDIPFLWVMDFGIRAILETAHFVSDLPGALILTPSLPSSALALFGLGFIGFVLWRGWARVLFLLLPALSLLQVLHHNQYDIYISSDHKLISYYKNKELNISSIRSGKFTREIWERASGVGEGASQKWPKESRDCGEQGCYVRLKGQRVAFSYKAYTHPQDCAWADILVAFEPVQLENCAAPVVIDKFDTWEYGAHAVKIEEGTGAIHVHRTADARGKRPWVQ